MNNTELTIDQLKMISGSEMGPNGKIGKYNDLTEFYVHNAERWGIENGFYSQFLINYPELASKSVSICHPKNYLKCGNYKYMLEQANLDELSILNTMKIILE